MKISWKWLNKEYFGGELPSSLAGVQPILKKLTMTSFEVESVEEIPGDDLLIDVKITPNRAHDCLCYNGLAREFALANDIDRIWQKPWKTEPGSRTGSVVKPLEVEVVEPKLCKRYIGRVIEDIRVSKSPKWLCERLNSIGQRSINNVVDAANYVMWITGQPMHAFDANKVSGGKIYVRKARKGEIITTLDNKEVALDDSVLVIADDKDPLAIAGIKGGKKAEVEEGTVNLILESANFHPTNIRKTSRAIGIKTDASYRFEHEISADVAGGAMEMLSDLILSVAKTSKTRVGSIVDKYERRPKQYKVGASRKEINGLLGLSLTEKDLLVIFDKLKKYSGFAWETIKPINKILEIAPKYIGTPYKYGSSITFDAPKFFDCSGFIAFIYSEAGIAIPRVSIDQYFFGDEVTEDDLRPGDLIFAVGTAKDHAKTHKETVEFLPGTKFEKGINHVGLYLGDGDVIHANGGSNDVSIEQYKQSKSFKNICGFRRILRDSESRFVVMVPPERLDLVSQVGFYKGGNKEDLIEEVARVYGCSRISSVMPDTVHLKPMVNKVYFYEELARSILCGFGFTETYNYAFVGGGDPKRHFKMANPLAEDKSFLRHNLYEGLVGKMEFNQKNKDLLDTDFVNVFEIGKVFAVSGEELHLALACERAKDLGVFLGKLSGELGISEAKLPVVEKGDHYVELRFDELVSKFSPKDSYKDLPSYVVGDKTIAYKKFSGYPHVVRDIAVFVPSEVLAEDVLALIKKEATDLLVKHKLFDIFVKKFEDGSRKTSYAFRLVFQSEVRTLAGEEINVIMDKITNVLNSKKEWKVR